MWLTNLGLVFHRDAHTHTLYVVLVSLVMWAGLSDLNGENVHVWLVFNNAYRITWRAVGLTHAETGQNSGNARKWSCFQITVSKERRICKRFTELDLSTACDFKPNDMTGHLLFEKQVNWG